MNDFPPFGRTNNPPAAPTQALRGTLKRVRFASDDGSFAVCDLDVPGQPVPLTVVGNIGTTRPGEEVELLGRWQENAKFGRQFAIEHIHNVLPHTAEGIERYLASGLVEGIGAVLAKRIVARFGLKTLEVLDADPGRIREVEGIGQVRAERIQRAWIDQGAVRTIMVFLRSQQVSMGHALKIYRAYGSEAVEILRTNPYRLADEIEGIGFQTADAIARQAGMDPDSEVRLVAGVLYVLSQAHGDGHMFLPIAALRQQASQLLGVEPERIGPAVEALRAARRLVLEPMPEDPAQALELALAPADQGLASEQGLAVYRPPAHRAEFEGARHLARLAHARAPGEPESEHDPALIDHHLAQVEAQLGFSLAPAQREAVRTAFGGRLCVITGGPGTGKTTLVRAICQLAKSLAISIALAAPTGRAARRLGEATSQEACTLHRLLQYSPKAGGFLRNEDEPLEVDLVIVDEASMVDAYLLHALVRALPDGTRLIFVGDVDQLPSVGPGNVLKDVIHSGMARVVRLNEIFRQASQSSIVTNAHRIHAGQMPVAPPRREQELTDFYLIQTEDPRQAQQRLVELVTTRIPRAFGVDALQDIQILAPMHKGEVGCQALNALFQETFFAHAPQLQRGQQRWKLGDKVMQVRNNYEQEVFNGDIGRVVEVDEEAGRLVVRFEEREVGYDQASLDELTLAYAITVHKSQGSEYPVVIIPVTTQHYVMLQRNLLYTAVTRARRLVVMVGTERAVALAVGNERAQLRHTALSRRLADLTQNSGRC